VIDSALAAFLQSGLSMVVGTRDADLRPEVARAVGLRVEADGAEATVFVPVSTGADTLANLEANGRIALTCSRPADHRTLQLKGGVLEIRAADERDRGDIERYRQDFAEVLGYVGVPPRLTGRVQAWPCHAVRFRVEALFQQTPGPGAGVALGRSGAERPA
jgi:hypothetical protein